MHGWREKTRFKIIIITIIIRIILLQEQLIVNNLSNMLLTKVILHVCYI